jgi:secondary thiamine-phosphate synthase enzyme
MRVHQELITVRTRGPGLVRIDDEVGRVLRASGLRDGLCTIFIRHTSASLLIQENAAPSARRDLEAYFARIAPENDPRYTHNDEGSDDMPAHLRAALTQTTLQVPVMRGELGLGTWQGLYVFEHRRQGSGRELIVQVMGV